MRRCKRESAEEMADSIEKDLIKSGFRAGKYVLRKKDQCRNMDLWSISDCLRRKVWFLRELRTVQEVH